MYELFKELQKQDNAEALLGFIALERIYFMPEVKDYKKRVNEVISKYFENIEVITKSRAATRD